MHHIIKKQVIDLMLNKKADAFAIQHLVSNHFREKIVPVLQEVFDGMSSEEETIYIDVLEVDLGNITVNEIERGQWQVDIFKKITEQWGLIRTGSAEKNIRIKPRAISFSEQWMYYMDNGYLPWNAVTINDAWYQSVIEAFAMDSSAIKSLRNLISHKPNAVRRIIHQHPGQFLQSLIETLTAEKQEALPALIRKILNTFSILRLNQEQGNALSRKELLHNLWEEILKNAASGDQQLTPRKILARVLTSTVSNAEIISKIENDISGSGKVHLSTIKKIKKTLKTGQDSGTEKIYSEINESDNFITTDIEGVFVKNAGMVLLHPFLNRFFNKLGLIQESNFISNLAHQKALYLLHYLCTGAKKPEEYELVIAKILCAYPLDEPVEKALELAIHELREADELLISAIQQWDVLKGTSPAGLREAFLQRTGKLFSRNETHCLQVEPGPIDMLLDQLPYGWNLSLVMLPWMKDVLKIEWR